jgi:SP family myo-inositol transporter-like MFS transporter 13
MRLLTTPGPLAGILLIDRMGRRKLVMSSLVGVVIALGLLSFSFHQAALDSPAISPGPFEPQPSLQCPLLPAGGQGRAGKASCMSCLGANCGFCAAAGDEVRRPLVFTNLDGCPPSAETLLS